MSRFIIDDLPLAGLKRLRRQRMVDSRGFLSRLFCAMDLAAAGWHAPVAQVNHTFTALRGTVRGLHYQNPPHAEAKLVSCTCGSVWDVAVDLRAGSATFLKWHAEYLSADNLCSLLIPKGFAHGFQALTDDAEMLYFHSLAYVPAAEGGLNPLDSKIAIDWPLPIQAMSDKDSARPMISDGFSGLAP